MTFGTLLWESVILTKAALLLRDLAGIGSAPRIELTFFQLEGAQEVVNRVPWKDEV